MCCPHKATRTGTAALCHSAAGPFLIYSQIGFSAVSQMAHTSYQNGLISQRENSLLKFFTSPFSCSPPPFTISGSITFAINSKRQQKSFSRLMGRSLPFQGFTFSFPPVLTNFCPLWGNPSHLTPFPCPASVGTWEHSVTY